MSYSRWYTEVILPGSNASSVTVGEQFSSEFPWSNNPVTKKLSYALDLFDVGDENLPKVGENTTVIVSGAKEFVYSERKQDSLFTAVRSYLEQNTSSSSSSSSSSSGSSSSSASS